MKITETKQWKVFIWIGTFTGRSMGWVFLLSTGGILYLMDRILMPEVKTAEDEGIYIGFLMFSGLLSVVVLLGWVCLLEFITCVCFPKCYKHFHNN